MGIDVIACILLTNTRRNAFYPKERKKEEKNDENHNKEIIHVFPNVRAFFGVQAKWADELK